MNIFLLVQQENRKNKQQILTKRQIDKNEMSKRWEKKQKIELQKCVCTHTLIDVYIRTIATTRKVMKWKENKNTKKRSKISLFGSLKHYTPAFARTQSKCVWLCFVVFLCTLYTEHCALFLLRIFVVFIPFSHFITITYYRSHSDISSFDDCSLQSGSYTFLLLFLTRASDRNRETERKRNKMFAGTHLKQQWISHQRTLLSVLTHSDMCATSLYVYYDEMQSSEWILLIGCNCIGVCSVLTFTRLIHEFWLSVHVKIFTNGSLTMSLPYCFRILLSTNEISWLTLRLCSLFSLFTFHKNDCLCRTYYL